MQYDLVKEKVTRQACPNGNIKPRKYYYPWSSYNTMDLSVDESGLWVLYSYSGYSGKLCATQLDPLTLGALNSYYGISSDSMTSMGNAFSRVVLSTALITTALTQQPSTTPMTQPPLAPEPIQRNQSKHKVYQQVKLQQHGYLQPS